MTLSINVSIDSSGINKAALFVAQIKNQLPFATSLALNNTAFKVRQAMKDQVGQSFASPTAFTRNAFRYDRSTKSTLEARVYADPSRRFVPTQIMGGTRKRKPYEGFLSQLGDGLAGKMVPTRHVINAAGNPRKSVFSLIQSRMSTIDQGGFFVGRPLGGGRAPGVYRRSRGKLFAYFVQTDEPSYEPRFPFEQVGRTTIARTFPSELNSALERALRSSR
jgi:hypothetical protein